MKRKRGVLVRFIMSFVYAFRGLFYALRHERNMRIHLCMTILVIGLAACERVQPWEWAVLLLCIGIVIGTELLNTAVESVCDALMFDQDEQNRHAKDCAAAGVLIPAIISAVIGVIILFGSGRWALICTYFYDNRLALMGLLFVLCLMLAFCFAPEIAQKKGEDPQLMRRVSSTYTGYLERMHKFNSPKDESNRRD